MKRFIDGNAQVKEPTVHDIARLAGVSIGTVSNVLNGKPSVKQTLSEKVRAAASRLGYRRNSNAASLRSNQTDMIAVVVPNIENSFFSEIVSAIEHRAVSERKGVTFMTTGEDQERAQQQIYNLISRRVDGLILVASFDYQPLLRELEVYGIPVVLADRVEEKNPFPSVAVDNRQAGYIGGRHLFASGYEQIAFFNHGQRFWILNERREGFAKAAREAGALRSCRFYDFGLDPEEIRVATVDILQSPRRPRAIFAASNIAGRGIIPAIQQLRFGMPDDVALLVMDDFEALTLLSPPVSVVSQPAREIAETSWRMLQTLIAGKRLKQRHPRLPATLIVRGSTGSVREGLSAKARRSVVEPYRGAAK
jgi:LacI family transcriptional regulator, galactose operon repressor